MLSLKVVLPILGLVVMYVVLSFGRIAFSQRDSKLYTEFQYPATTVLCYAAFNLFAAGAIRYLYAFFTGKSCVQVSFGNTVKQLAPAGLATGVAIVSMFYILEKQSPRDVYLLLMSSAFVFLLIFSILFGLEKKSCILMVTVALISLGLGLSGYQLHQIIQLRQLIELNFHVIDIDNWYIRALILIASAIIAIRWTSVQYIMEKSKLGIKNPIDLMYFMQPWVILPVLLVVLLFEGDGLKELIHSIHDSSSAAKFENNMAILACFEFALQITEYFLLSHTSSLTLAIVLVLWRFGVLVYAYHDYLTVQSYLLGPDIFFIGVVIYITYKWLTSKDESIPKPEDKKTLI